MPKIEFFSVLALILAWLASAMIPGAVRRALRDGLRCMIRYPDFWRIPAGFGFAYAAFNLAGILILMHRTGAGFHGLARRPEWPDALPPFTAALSGAWLLAGELLGGVFHSFGPTFPASAAFGALFLANSGGYLGELAAALRRRFGPFGWLLLMGLLVCGLAAVAKPVIYLALPELISWRPGLPWLSIATGVDAASFAFEFLLGVCFQVYLMLMASAWSRGIRFDRAKLMRLAVRRLGFVMKWSLLLLGAIVCLVQIPLLAELLFPGNEEPSSLLNRAVLTVFRPAIAAVMILFCAVQAKLVFHNESLRQGLSDGIRFFRKNAPGLSAFLVSGFCPFLIMVAVGNYLHAAFSVESAPSYAWLMLQPVLLAFLSGWLVAAWVQFFRSAEGRAHALF